MDRYGYDKRLSCGTVATVGTLGVLIPPSVTLIIYGILTETSIGKLFLAGIIPGLIIAFSFVITLYGWCKINPKLGPKGEKSTWKERFASLPPVLWVLIIFILVVGGLMQGYFTPTEAGSVGTFAVLILTLAKREMNLKSFIKSINGHPAHWLHGHHPDRRGHHPGPFLCRHPNPLYGGRLSGEPSLKPEHYHGPYLCRLSHRRVFYRRHGLSHSGHADLFAPGLKLGYDPVWFGVIVCVITMIGIILPPMAINVFVVSGVTKVPINTIYKGIYPYIIGMYICLFIFLFFPQISLWLPNLFLK